jgi:hypothetical protein
MHLLAQESQVACECIDDVGNVSELTPPHVQGSDCCWRRRNIRSSELA